MSSGLTEKFYERQIVGNTVGLDYWSAFDEPYPSSEEKQNELDEPEKTEEPVKKGPWPNDNPLGNERPIFIDFLKGDSFSDGAKICDINLSVETADTKQLVSSANKIIAAIENKLRRPTDLIFLLDLKTRFQDCKSFEQFRQAFNSFALDQSLVNYLRCEKLPEESRFLINNGTPLSSLWINFLRKNLRGISSQHLLTGKMGIECLGDFISKLESQDKDRTLNAYLKTGIYRNYFISFLSKNFNCLSLEDSDFSEQFRQLLASIRLFYSYKEFKRGLLEDKLWERYSFRYQGIGKLKRLNPDFMSDDKKEAVLKMLKPEEFDLVLIERSYENLQQSLFFSSSLYKSFPMVIAGCSFSNELLEKKDTFLQEDQVLRNKAKKHCRSLLTYTPNYLYIFFIDFLTLSWKYNLYKKYYKKEILSEDMDTLANFLKTLLFSYAMASKRIYKKDHLIDPYDSFLGEELNKAFLEKLDSLRQHNYYYFHGLLLNQY